MDFPRALLLAAAMLFFLGTAFASDIEFCNIALEHLNGTPVTSSSPVSFGETWHLKFCAYNNTAVSQPEPYWITDATIRVQIYNYQSYEEYVDTEWPELEDFGYPGSCTPGSERNLKCFDFYLKTEDNFVPTASKSLKAYVVSSQSQTSLGDFSTNFNYTRSSNYKPQCENGKITTNNCWCESKDTSVPPDGEYWGVGERACDIVQPYFGSEISGGCPAPGNTYCCNETYNGTDTCSCGTGYYNAPYSSYNCKPVIDVFYTKNTKTVLDPNTGKQNRFNIEMRVRRNLPATGSGSVGNLSVKLLYGKIRYAFVPWHSYYHDKDNEADQYCYDNKDPWHEQCDWFPWYINESTQTAEYMNSLASYESPSESGAQKDFVPDIVMNPPGQAGNERILNDNFTFRDSGGLYKFEIRIYYTYTNPFTGATESTYSYAYVDDPQYSEDYSTPPPGDSSYYNCGYQQHYSHSCTNPVVFSNNCRYYCYPRPKLAGTDAILYSIFPNFYYVAPDTQYSTKLHVMNWGQVDWPADDGSKNEQTVWARKKIISADFAILYPHLDPGEPYDAPEEQWAHLGELPFANPADCDEDWCPNTKNNEKDIDIDFSISKPDYGEFLKYASYYGVEVGVWKTTSPTGVPPNYSSKFYKLDHKAAKVAVLRLAMIEDEEISTCTNPDPPYDTCDCATTCGTVSWGPCEDCFRNALTDYLVHGQSKTYDLLLRNPLDTDSEYVLDYTAEPFNSPLGSFNTSTSFIKQTNFGQKFTNNIESGTKNSFTVTVPEETTLQSATYLIKSASTDFPTIGDEATLTIYFQSANIKIGEFFLCTQPVGCDVCAASSETFYTSENLTANAKWCLKAQNEGTGAKTVQVKVSAKNKEGLLSCGWGLNPGGEIFETIAEASYNWVAGSFLGCTGFEQGSYSLNADIPPLPEETVKIDNHETLYFTVGGGGQVVVPDAGPLAAAFVALIALYLVVRK